MPLKKKPRRHAQPQRLEFLDDEFYCKYRRRRLSLERCLSDYCDANAFNNRKSPCWCCPMGKIHRLRFSVKVEEEKEA